MLVRMATVPSDPICVGFLLLIIIIGTVFANESDVSNNPSAMELAEAILDYFPSCSDEIISCEGDVARLTCPPNTAIRVVKANYGRSDFPTCPHPQRTDLQCGDDAKSAQIVKASCDYRRHCVVTATNDVFGDPCVGTYKYLHVEYDCVEAFSILTCEGGSSRLTCPSGTAINVIASRYGRTEFQPCPHPLRSNLVCGSDSHSLTVVRGLCHGEQSCSVPSTNNAFGDPCGGTYKYLEASWTCVEGPVKAPATISPPSPHHHKRVCEHQQLTLTCPVGEVIQVKDALYGRTKFDPCPHALRSNLICRATNSLAVTGSRCNGHPSCVVHASNGVFGDPCGGTFKYLEASWICAKEDSIAVKNKLVCEGQTLTLTCPEGTSISIEAANYGRTVFDTCPHPARGNLNCKASNSLNVVEGSCKGKKTCTVPANNNVFGDPCGGTYKYLEVSWKCVKDAEKIGVQNKLACEGQTLALNCPEDKSISIETANYGRTVFETCPHPARGNLNCKASNSLSVVEGSCEGKKSCNVPATNGVFGDPCGGTYKYLEVSWKCVKDVLIGIKKKLACEGQALTLECPDEKSIRIETANYGRTVFETCPHPARGNLNCRSSNSLGIVNGNCNGRRSCTIHANNGVFGDPCGGTYKYLEVSWTCVKDVVIQHKLACEGHSLTLRCPEGKLLTIKAANYGRTVFETCPHSARGNLNCRSSNSLGIVNGNCKGRSSCTIHANNGVFGDPCGGTYKYLEVEYVCSRHGADSAAPSTNNLVITSGFVNASILHSRVRWKKLLYSGETTVEPQFYVNIHFTYLKAGEMTEARPPGLLFVSVLATIIIRTVLADAEAEIVVPGPPAKDVANAILDYVPDCDSNQEPLEIISCEGDVARLTCPPDTTIEVVSANYGRSDFPTCPHPKRSNLRCGNQIRSTVKVKSFCSRRRHCVVTATNGVFGDPCFGTYKYLRVKYKCVRALSVISCEGGLARLRCPKGTTIQVSAARYGRTEFHPCPHPQRSNLACGSLSKSLRVVRQRCNNKQNCNVPSTNGVFGDPCVGTYKYIEASWTCKVSPVVPPPPPNSDKHLLVCEHKPLKIVCPAGKVIQLKKAVYGRTEFKPCPHPARSNLNCRASNSFGIVNGRCKNRRSCSVPASNGVFGDPCRGTFKYLEVSWTCKDSPGVPPPPPPQNDKHLLVCEHKPLKLVCPTGKVIQLKKAVYGRTEFKPCPHPARSNLNCRASNSFGIVNGRCKNRRSCSVSASNGVFGDPCRGTFKYLEVSWTCKDSPVAPPPPPPQNDKHLLVCEHKPLTLVCPTGKVIQLKKAVYGRTEFKPCPHPARSNLNCRASNSFGIVNGRCKNRRSCSVSASNGVFGDPCRGTFKYLEVSWTCKDSPVAPPPPPPQNDKHLLVCEHKPLTLVCPTGKVIQLKKAVYGRTEFKPCPHPARSNLNCRASNSFGIVNGRCKNRRSCSVSASNGVFGDPCRGTFKYLEVSWTCKDSPVAPPPPPPQNDKHLLVCEHKPLTLVCPTGKVIQLKKAVYGRTEFKPCPHPARSNLNCRASNSFGIVNGRCKNRRSCSVSASNGVFGDPCRGTFKYLEVSWTCKDSPVAPPPPPPQNDEHLLVCEHKPLKLVCPTGKVIQLKKAVYGRTEFKPCPHPARSNLNCRASNSFGIVNGRCKNRRSCSVSASNGVFGDPCRGTFKYLEVSWTCKDSPVAPPPPPPQNDKHLLVCEHKPLTLVCPTGKVIQLKKAVYGRTEFKPCPHPARSNLNCRASNSFGIVNGRCKNRRSCSVSASNGVFGDPCRGTFKYLEVSWTCKDSPVAPPPPPPQNDKHLLVCEHKPLKLVCPTGKVIQLKKAVYGRTEFKPCPHPARSNLNCRASNSFGIVNGRCKNRRSCSVSASNGVFGDPCRGTFKYLEVSWTCKDSPVAPPPPPPQNGKHLLVCEHKPLTLVCPAGKVIQLKKAVYGRTEFKPCPHSARSNLNCRASNSFGIVNGRCKNRRSCSVPASNGVFGDPCRGTFKYLEASWTCVNAPPVIQLPVTVRKRIVCEGKALKLNCYGKSITIKSANYGRTNGFTCPHSATSNRNCRSSKSLGIVKGSCGGRKSCTVSATNRVFGDPCGGTYKYLEVQYVCS
ncbi:uncharacterized protein [Oscarella lobularis]|uniref:uncharacterized protein n=1 Tax=Oscarella lobularis TaxID=121494 RepID=UPI0033132B64